VFPPFYDKEDLTLARFTHVESIDSTKPEDVQAFFEMMVSQKCEGLMVKLLESGEGLAGEDDDDENLPIDLDKVAKEKEKANGGRKKPLPSTYEPDARSQGWLKVKKGTHVRVVLDRSIPAELACCSALPDYLEGMGDSLDLVPIGAWWGLGRKAGWWSPILLALYNPETGALEAVCKCE
jgi:DNA ligase-1